MTLVDNLQLTVWATSYGLSPFHPAVTDDLEVWYWPNVAMFDERAATDWAELALKSARQAARDVMAQWNVCEGEPGLGWRW